MVDIEVHLVYNRHIKPKDAFQYFYDPRPFIVADIIRDDLEAFKDIGGIMEKVAEFILLHSDVSHNKITVGSMGFKQPDGINGATILREKLVALAVSRIGTGQPSFVVPQGWLGFSLVQPTDDAAAAAKPR